MNNITLNRIRIQRYRSLKDLVLTFQKGKPLIICGSNNVGKTNTLRALDLYFSFNPDNFDSNRDIPYEIDEGSRGGNFNTTITGFFKNETEEIIEIKEIFKNLKNKGSFLEIKSKIGQNKLEEKDAKSILQMHKYLFIEASNIDIPKIIDEIIDEQILPFGLDHLRKKQTEPLDLFKKFIESSRISVETITDEIEKILNDFIIDIPGIDTKDWKLKILFYEYERLREALSGNIEFTLFDKNDRMLDSKGSGIQRIILLSLMKYIAEKTSKKIIWGIDEPEAFLQPALQKRVFTKLKDIAQKQEIILTTHSNNFVDLSDISNTFLFEALHERKEFKRKPNVVFLTTDTFIKKGIRDNEKINNIKSHLGIENTDSWAILPYNILVEGEEDKEYFKSLAKAFNFDVPNILVSGGASKIKGYLQFLQEFCNELSYTPTVRIILDHDDEGKREYESIKKDIERTKYKKINLFPEYVPRCDGIEEKTNDYEVEDFIYPEIIRESVNKFLKNEGYKIIEKKCFQNRFSLSYNKECILKYIGDIVREKNPNKEPKPFEKSDSGLKSIICKYSCILLSKTDLNNYDRQFPVVKKFIENICKSNQ